MLVLVERPDWCHAVLLAPPRLTTSPIIAVITPDRALSTQLSPQGYFKTSFGLMNLFGIPSPPHQPSIYEFRHIIQWYSETLLTLYVRMIRPCLWVRLSNYYSNNVGRQPADLCVEFQSFSLTDRLFEIKKLKYWIWIFSKIAAIQSFQLLQPRVEQRENIEADYSCIQTTTK